MSIEEMKHLNTKSLKITEPYQIQHMVTQVTHSRQGKISIRFQ